MPNRLAMARGETLPQRRPEGCAPAAPCRVAAEGLEGESKLKGTVRGCGGVVLLPLPRQGDFPWFCFRWGIKTGEWGEAGAQAGDSPPRRKDPCQSRGDGDMVVPGGEAIGKACLKLLLVSAGEDGLCHLFPTGTQENIKITVD